MIGLEKLQIRDYGANKRLDIEFSPYVTCIIGKNYAGKSWALRALRWLSLNKPAGDSFINWDSDKAKVIISVDGKRIIRTRGKNTNLYRLSGKKEPFVAFGNDVPDEIAKILNLSTLNFRGVNTLGQHEPPYWFCETAGEVSRQLNSIVNLKVIDSTLANIDSEKRKTKQEIVFIEEALEKTIKNRKKLDYIEEMNQDLINIEKLEKAHLENARICVLLAELVNQVGLYEFEQENLLNQAADALKAKLIGGLYLEIADSTKKLSNLVESAQKLENILKNRPPDIQPLIRIKERMDKVGKQCDRLYELIENAKMRKEEKCREEILLNKIKKLLEETAGGRCPLCGAKMKK